MNSIDNFDSDLRKEITDEKGKRDMDAAINYLRSIEGSALYFEIQTGVLEIAKDFNSKSSKDLRDDAYWGWERSDFMYLITEMKWEDLLKDPFENEENKTSERELLKKAKCDKEEEHEKLSYQLILLENEEKELMRAINKIYCDVQPEDIIENSENNLRYIQSELKFMNFFSRYFSEKAKDHKNGIKHEKKRIQDSLKKIESLPPVEQRMTERKAKLAPLEEKLKDVREKILDLHEQKSKLLKEILTLADQLYKI